MNISKEKKTVVKNTIIWVRTMVNIFGMFLVSPQSYKIVLLAESATNLFIHST